MDSLTRSHLQSLISSQRGPCVSIFTQTHRGGSEQDPIRLRGQIQAAEKQLQQLGHPEATIDALLKPARALLLNVDFWKNTADGLALFSTEGSFQTFRLRLTMPNEAVVGPRFHVKPLLPWFSGDGYFYILAVSQNQVRLLLANAHEAHLIRSPGAPADLNEAQRSHDRDEILNFHTHPGSYGKTMQAVFHGHGVGIDDHKTELTHYFQEIDHAVCRATGDHHVPLVLATVDYLAAIYRKLSKYPHVLAEGVHGNPDHLSEAQLHAKALPLATPHLRHHEEQTLAQFRRLVGTGRTSNDLAQILPSAGRGELETLLLVAERNCWGKFDQATQVTEVHPTPMPGDEELINLAATLMLQHKRLVQTVAPEPAFDGSPVAGIFFVPLPHHGK